ncbi:hypothetical protein HWV62_28922 [Athelia sp. TMB]|nr:hypothetical protein HWV62_28922 [Athelia sp. TMB]
MAAGATDEALQKAYLDWAGRVRFEYCDLSVPSTDGKGGDDEDIPHYKFYYSNEARMLANSDIPKRSLAIAKELAVLTTNLPVAWDSSIFLRVDETRVDVIKALITGPEGTPYLFDIFLGPSYNQSPPSVKYMTDGKSMILCDEPYLNEPGWASSGGTPQSRAYSANVRRMVVKTAMLGNLRNPPEPFAEIIRTHFRLKSRSISAQLDQWLAQDDGAQTNNGDYGGSPPKGAGASSNGFAKDVEDLKRAMQDLQQTS